MAQRDRQRQLRPTWHLSNQTCMAVWEEPAPSPGHGTNPGKAPRRRCRHTQEGSQGPEPVEADMPGRLWQMVTKGLKGMGTQAPGVGTPSGQRHQVTPLHRKV